MDLDISHCRAALCKHCQDADDFTDLLPLLQAIDIDTLKQFVDEEIPKWSDELTRSVFDTSLPISARVCASEIPKPKKNALSKPGKSRSLFGGPDISAFGGYFKDFFNIYFFIN